MAIVVVFPLIGCIQQVRPNISMQKIAPQQRGVGQSADYTITLNNVGDGRATDVVVRDTIPEAMSYLTSSPTGHYDPRTRSVSWRVGTMEAGAGTSLGLVLRANGKGEQCNVAELEAAGGIRATARSCTMLAGLAELKVFVRDTPDPVEVGFTTTYTVEVKNQGSETATNVRVKVSLPKGFSYVTSSGPTAARVAEDVVRFDPLPTLPPNASVPYRIVARAQTPGAGRFEAQVAADHLSTPVNSVQVTRVSGDTPVSPDTSARRRPANGLTHLGARDQVRRLISVENVLVRGRAVTGRVVNKSSRSIRDVVLMIRSVWLWDDELNPGPEDPSVSVRYRVPGEVRPQGFLPFVYRPLPIPPRADGYYETRVSVAEFSEIP
jgi:uncharacterized repeat protein (TIGR01451 family)